MTNQPLEAFKRVSDSLDRAAQKIMDDHQDRVTNCIKRQLADWQRRFPRHKFKAWEAHGLLSFEVHPPVMGEKYVSDLTYNRTGNTTLADLAAEAREFQDIYNLEWKVCLIPRTSIIEI
jgi:hypothetical protein